MRLLHPGCGIPWAAADKRSSNWSSRKRCEVGVGVQGRDGEAYASRGETKSKVERVRVTEKVEEGKSKRLNSQCITGSQWMSSANRGCQTFESFPKKTPGNEQRKEQCRDQKGTA